MQQLQEAPQSQQTSVAAPHPPQTETSTTTPRHPKPAPRGSARCSHRTRNKGRCRLPVQDPSIGLCFRHAGLARQEILHDTLDLSDRILAKQEGAYDSPESINSILSNVIELLAQGLISTRRASVITYALSLMLRSSVVAERQASNQLPLDYVPRRPIDDPPFPPSTTPAEAIAAYERLRS